MSDDVRQLIEAIEKATTRESGARIYLGRARWDTIVALAKKVASTPEQESGAPRRESK